MRIRSLTVAALFGCGLFAQSLDWPRVHAEAVDHLVKLIRIDTTSPPGNETKAAEYVRNALRKEGLAANIFALEPSRGNLVCRFKGNGKKRPVMLLGHTDVVGVQREKWPLDPFAGIRKDGYIFGRGASDDKVHVAAGIMLMALLQRYHVKLDRDVIFLAEAGEEGTTRVGIDYMVAQHWPEIDAEFSLAEGGGAVERNGKVQYVQVDTSEKIPRGMKLVAHGLAGHASKPSRRNAVLHLAAAVAKFEDWQPPMRLSDTTRTYFERLAAVSPPAAAARYRTLLAMKNTAEVENYLAEHEPDRYTLLRTSIVPTILNAGFRSNVIPSEAEATLDVRALPDEDVPALVEQIRKVIGDPTVEVVPPRAGGRPAAPPSRIDTPMFAALEAVSKRMYPGSAVMPGIGWGATDSAQLRAKGVQAYGIGPVTVAGVPGGAHTDDERMREASVHKFVEFLWYTVLELAASKE